MPKIISEQEMMQEPDKREYKETLGHLNSKTMDSDFNRMKH